MPGRSVPAPLPVWEQALYWITEVVTIVYMLYSLYHASEAAWRRNEPIRIEGGWAVIGRPKDAADFEWEFWSSYFLTVLPGLCGHVIVSLTATALVTSLRARYTILTVYSVLVLSYLLGLYTVLLLCVQPVVLYLVSNLGSTKLVWLTTLIFLTVLNYYENGLAQWLYSFHERDDFSPWFYMCVFVWANLCQRATGFALERVWVHQSQTTPLAAEGDAVRNGSQLAPNFGGWRTLTEVPGWLDLFFYMFYFPLFFTGPLIVYDSFHQQAEHPQPCTRARLGDVVFKLARILFWAVLNSVLLHFLYAHAINGNSLVLAKQSRWTLAAIGYLLGQFFMVKYLVLFGLPAQLARLDGFEPPAVPACISYIYCYSDMWKFFDRGLYNFLKRYIFIPFGGSRAGLGRQVLGSVLCFAYIFYWHGAEFYLFLWTVINFVETGLEQVGAWLENTCIVRTYLYDRLSPAGKRRIRAVVSVPMFLMSVFAIFYFFGGTDSGIIFLQRLLVEIPWGSFSLFMLLVYCAIQNAMEVERLGLSKLKVSAHRD